MPCTSLSMVRSCVLRKLTLRHALHTTAPALEKSLPPRRILADSELVENFLKGSGPGGQKINKTSSAVQLKHIPTGIVVKYQDTRSREINRKMARRILQDKIEELELGDQARTRVRAREKSKRKASSDKKKRRKYRALDEGSDTTTLKGAEESVGNDDARRVCPRDGATDARPAQSEESDRSPGG